MACAYQSESELWNSQTSKSTWRLALAAVSGTQAELEGLYSCWVSADLGFKEINVDSLACYVMVARVPGCAAGPAPRHWPSESGSKAIYKYYDHYTPCKHAGSVLVVKAAGCYARDCGFEAGALHELSFMYFLFMAKWNWTCYVSTWYIHSLNIYLHEHTSIQYFSNSPVQPSWPYMQC